MSARQGGPSRARTPTMIASLVLVALVLAACGAMGSPAADVSSGLNQAAEAPGQPRPAADSAEGRDGFAADQGSPIDRSIVKTGEVTVEVASVGSALGQVRAMAVDLGGHVGGSQAGTIEDRATVTLRIPAHRFDEALERLHELDGQVVAEVTREEDVTGTIVDLEARIANLRASEEQYRLLLERAEEIDDILNVQSRLDQVRGQIEQLQAQHQQIKGQADLATLTVSLVPQPRPIEETAEGWNPGATVDEALGALLAIGQGLITLLIWLGVVWLPILLVLAIIAMLVLRGLIELRRRGALSTRPATGGEPPTSA